MDINFISQLKLGFKQRFMLGVGLVFDTFALVGNFRGKHCIVGTPKDIVSFTGLNDYFDIKKWELGDNGSYHHRRSVIEEAHNPLLVFGPATLEKICDNIYVWEVS